MGEEELQAKTKTCVTCGIVHPLENFYVYKKKYRRAHCIKCYLKNGQSYQGKVRAEFKAHTSMRPCMRCGRSFRSRGIGNRHCPQCAEKIENTFNPIQYRERATNESSVRHYEY
jgi:hypothetical protein